MFFERKAVLMDADKPALVDKLALVQAAIMRSWSKDTARPAVVAHWTEKNPSLGQNVVTVLLVQETMEGYIVRTNIPGFGLYYYNILPDGTVCDLTKSQFPPGTNMPPGEVVAREDMLGTEQAVSERTQERYALLLSRFMDLILG